MVPTRALCAECIVLSVTIAFVAGGPAGAQPAPTCAFPNADTYPVEARDVAIADLDGDGVLDLAVAGSSTSVLLGVGDGTFVATAAYPVTSQSVVVGDLNGDRIPDLAVTGSGGTTISVFIGVGDGTFGAAVPYEAGSGPYDLALDDFDGDSALDIAVTNQNSDDVSILLNLGDGTFGPADDYAVGDSPRGVGVGDFDGDGNSDLAVIGQFTNDVTVRLGAGDGTFGSAVTYAVSDCPRTVVVADFNEDGALDLATANQLGGVDFRGNVSVLLGNGDGTFAAPVEYSGAGTGPTGIELGDLDGDGNVDLAIANFRSGDVAVLFGQGDGTFVPGGSYGLGDQPVRLALGDLDDDGDLDVAAANVSSSDVSVLFGIGDGTLISDVTYDVVIEPTSVAVGDLNGDGALDLAVTNFQGPGAEVSIQLGTGDGTFAPQVTYAVGGGRPVSVAIGDFNEDGDPDLAVADQDSSAVAILLGAGDGTFGAAVAYGVGGPPASVALGDFDGDDDLDLVTANLDGAVAILLGDGEGGFGPANTYGAGDFPSSVAVGDLNGDGALDLAVANQFFPDLAILLGQGDGTFAPSVFISVDGFAQFVALGDVDADGNLDLAVSRLFGTVAVLLGAGDGTFSSAVGYGVGDTPNGVAVADLNGDGVFDLAVANEESDDISVLLGTGDGTFGTAATYGAGSRAFAIAAGDLDGDGDVDLAVANLDAWNVSILVNDCAGACCFDDGSCAELSDNACVAAGGIFQSGIDCAKADCPVFLESVDVAIRDAATGNRVFVRGFRDGTVEHKFFTAAGGYTPWTEVPDPGGVAPWIGPRLEAVEAIALDPEALLYIRAFDDGRFEQNIYTRANGWTGWLAVPHPPSAQEGKPCEELGPNGADVVESVDIEPFDGLPGARMFVRAWRSGLIEQCVYTPADGYTPWSAIPPMGDLVDIVEGIGEETVESVQVTAEGGLFDRRLFIIGLKESRRVYQNIYDPMSGYTGWVRVRNSATEAGLPNENSLVSADVQHLGDGAVLYLRGRANGRVDQNIYTPADGFSGFNRLTRVDNPDDRVMESCCVELIDPGLFGHRIYLRCFRDGTVQQAFYSPQDGQSRFDDVPGG